MKEDYRDLVKNIAVIRVPSYHTERILLRNQRPR